MWEPVGPLPASVYWRRRAVAAAALLATIVTLSWAVTGLIAPAPTTILAPNPVAMSAPQEDPPSSATAPGTAEGAADPTTAAISTSEQLQPDETPRPSVPLASPLPVPPTGPVPCTNDMLAVTAEIANPTYRVGERPVLRLVITNSSGQPCVRDLDAARQEIVVWSGDGAARLWSSNDCVNASAVDLRTLVPGQPVVSSVTWAGRTSTPGCKEARTAVPAGDYRVRTRLDDDISAPVPFRLTP